MSPQSVWKDGYITDANYLKEQSLFIIDVDKDLTLEDAKSFIPESNLSDYNNKISSKI